MTLRTKELNSTPSLEQYSQELLRQSVEHSSYFDLTGEKALFTLTHPALMRIKQIYSLDPAQLTYKNNSYGYYFQTFKTVQEAKNFYPKLPVTGGFPKDLYQWLQTTHQPTVMDFQDLGAVIIQSDALSDFQHHTPGLEDFLLSGWLDYALSPELWGPAGKWTRFHQRLHGLFHHKKLLTDKDLPGYYPLTKSNQWIKDHGFYGKENSDNFTLILPWDFPLSGLVKLENILAQEP